MGLRGGWGRLRPPRVTRCPRSGRGVKLSYLHSTGLVWALAFRQGDEELRAEFDRAIEGQPITGAGVNLDRVRRRLGMVFQAFNLYPHLDARRNVTLALRKVLKLPRDQADARAEAALAQVGLADKAASYPAELSGGQQQRVAIARAIALEPAVMLFDEPTSALDPELVGDVLAVMRELKSAGMTMLVVSHEMAFAREAADRVVFMAEGRIVEAGPPEAVFGAPRHESTRAFLARYSNR
ncbi:MAG: ATP-binding cassette domain-containing protein [Rhodobacteraceae bacterium]|nr:ATP-binding cassette domain-containing protein [Paracoccaceae bacterium]